MKETIQKIKQNGVWKIGAVCILIGLIGFGIEYYHQYSRHPHRLITTTSPVVLHWQPVKNISETAELIPEVIQKFAAQQLGVSWSQIHPWNNKEGFAFQSATGEWIWALEINDKKAYKDFLDSFLVSGETMTEKKIKNWKVLKPSFSSDIAFTQWGKWAIIAPNETQIVTLKEGDLLVDSSEWKTLQRDLPDDYLLYSYIDTQRAVKSIPEDSKLQSMKLMMFAFSEANQHLATALVPRDGHLQTYVKWLHAEELEIPVTSNFKKIPNHAQMIPSDSFYWSHGQNLEGEYEAALSFWKTKYKALPTFVDGVFETYFQKYFGESFSFRDNLLKLSDKEYSVLFDYDGTIPQTAFFVDLPEDSKQETLGKMVEFFKAHQIKKYPQVLTEVSETNEEGETITKSKIIPNTVDNIKIEEVETLDIGTMYYLSEEKSADDFAIGMIGNTLILSSQVGLMEDIFATYAQADTSLAFDPEFSEAIEERLSPSPKHGHLNLASLSGVMNLLTEDDELGIQEVLSQVNELSFASKKTPNATFINFILWENSEEAQTDVKTKAPEPAIEDTGNPETGSKELSY